MPWLTWHSSICKIARSGGASGSAVVTASADGESKTIKSRCEISLLNPARSTRLPLAHDRTDGRGPNQGADETCSLEASSKRRRLGCIHLVLTLYNGSTCQVRISR